MKTAVIMPVLDPDEKTMNFLESLLSAGFGDIIIVDDGSGERYRHYFDEAAANPEVTVLTHDVNMGKGRALKDALSYLAKKRPDIERAVTVDGDGQHNIASISACLACSDKNPCAVILGGRDFDKCDIPKRSRLGNKISGKVYKFAIGIKLNDTQTGLRVIPAKYFEIFSLLKGERYEYETNMLIAIMNMKLDYIEVPIETIYIDDNSSSHFHPIKDSWRIYSLAFASFAKYSLSSFVSWLIDIAIYAVLAAILSGRLTGTWNIFGFWELDRRIFICTAASTLGSSFFNYFLNRKMVFRSNGKVGRTAAKYYTLVAFKILASWLLVDLFATKILKVDGVLEVLVKCVVDTCLFVVNYAIQRKWVFKNKKVV